ncbi:hypothetical protein [Paenibacillus sp. SI8]|uniref:hypothetical protein n=1 Tax=unclassified Paenibacillus TaxID=185978 RepID=UPI003466276A
MRLNRQDDERLTQSLNKLLDEMPLIEPTLSFTDRVMRSIQEPEIGSVIKPKKPRWRNDMVNGLVAAAATVLLIQSGIVSKILTIDTEITHLTAYLQQISQLLQS